VRRGYFVDGLGAAQFAEPGADELLRSEREAEASGVARMLAATDPASPWGTALPWPARDGARPMRADGAQVILGPDASLLAWLGRGERSLLTFFADDGYERARQAKHVAEALAHALEQHRRGAFLIAQVDGEDVGKSALAEALTAVGFQTTSRGYLKRAARKKHGEVDEDLEAELTAD
jgi:ATP-dependent Lhr-like helicase